MSRGSKKSICELRRYFCASVCVAGTNTHSRWPDGNGRKSIDKVRIPNNVPVASKELLKSLFSKKCQERGKIKFARNLQIEKN